MMEEAVKCIRSRTREITIQERQKNRENVLNRHRELGSITKYVYSVSDVITIADRLKQKGCISTSQLSVLMNALIQDKEHITAFFKTPGALHGLVKILTDGDGSKQELSASCCCNLSMGEERTSLLLARAAGPYLIAHTDTYNTQLMESCCMSLGNLCGSGPRVCGVLLQQGLLGKLLYLLGGDREAQVLDAAAYAVNKLITHTEDDLEIEKFEKAIRRQILHPEDSDQMFWLLFLLSSNKELHHIFTDLFSNCLSLLLARLHDQQSGNLVQVNCMLRVAANLCTVDILQDYDLYSYEGLSAIIGMLLASPSSDIKKETMWFIGNLLNFSPDSDVKVEFFNAISHLLT